MKNKTFHEKEEIDLLIYLSVWTYGGNVSSQGENDYATSPSCESNSHSNLNGSNKIW